MASSEQGLHHNLVQYRIHFIYHSVHCEYKKAIANCRNVGRLGVNCYMQYNLYNHDSQSRSSGKSKAGSPASLSQKDNEETENDVFLLSEEARVIH